MAVVRVVVEHVVAMVRRRHFAPIRWFLGHGHLHRDDGEDCDGDYQDCDGAPGEGLFHITPDIWKNENINSVSIYIIC